MSLNRPMTDMSAGHVAANRHGNQPRIRTTEAAAGGNERIVTVERAGNRTTGTGRAGTDAATGTGTDVRVEATMGRVEIVTEVVERWTAVTMDAGTGDTTAIEMELTRTVARVRDEDETRTSHEPQADR